VAVTAIPDRAAAGSSSTGSRLLQAMAGAGRGGLGLALGAVSAVGHLVLLVPAAVALVVPAGRPAVAAAAAALSRIELVRVSTLLDPTVPLPGHAPDGRRAARYLTARLPAGLLAGVLLGLLGFGALVAVAVLWSWWTATPFEGDPSFVVDNVVLAYWLVPGLLLLYLDLAGLAGVARWERAAVRWFVAPTREEQLVRRVAALAESRAAVVAAVDDERRRIERDLHDGVQQRLVALGMLLGRARRHPDRTDLLEQAHEQAQRALVDLREVSWRVYPAALDTDGLAAALESVAERAPLPVDITGDLPEEPPPAIRAAAWFVVCEAVTNAAKHSGADRVRVELAGSAAALTVTVSDDGRGGADPAGGGLAGLARRVAAADGRLDVRSPAGGPTVVRAELPCG
jgi:signal transduction histidine kinase